MYNEMPEKYLLDFLSFVVVLLLPFQ